MEKTTIEKNYTFEELNTQAQEAAVDQATDILADVVWSKKQDDYNFSMETLEDCLHDLNGENYQTLIGYSFVTEQMKYALTCFDSIRFAFDRYGDFSHVTDMRENKEYYYSIIDNDMDLVEIPHKSLLKAMIKEDLVYFNDKGDIQTKLNLSDHPKVSEWLSEAQDQIESLALKFDGYNYEETYALRIVGEFIDGFINMVRSSTETDEEVVKELLVYDYQDEILFDADGYIISS